MNYDDKKLVHITHTVCKMFCDIADYTIIYRYKKSTGLSHDALHPIHNYL